MKISICWEIRGLSSIPPAVHFTAWMELPYRACSNTLSAWMEWRRACGGRAGGWLVVGNREGNGNYDGCSVVILKEKNV